MNNLTFRIMNSRLLVQVVLLMTLATYADAAVTNVVWHRLGEDDPGAAPGIAATATANLIGGRNLTETGMATGPLNTARYDHSARAASGAELSSLGFQSRDLIL